MPVIQTSRLPSSSSGSLHNAEQRLLPTLQLQSGFATEPVLIVLSAADTWTRADGSAYESGVWAQEFVDLDEAFIRAGFWVDLASPGGIVPTMDKRSLDPRTVGETV